MKCDKIYIVGYMGSGKTTTAKRLAKKIGWSFLDLDKAIEEKYQISIEHLFEKFGEEVFRKLESEVLHQTADLTHTIIATGGGTPCYHSNMEWMNTQGITVFIKVSAESAADRITHSKKVRPLAQGKTPEELLTFIREHYQKRLPQYEKALYTVKGENCDLDALQALMEAEGCPIL